MQRKDAERIEARLLRAEGMSIKAIAKQLGVAVSSVSVWVRDVPTPPPAPAPAPAPPEPVRSLPPVDPDEPTRHCPRCGLDVPLSGFNRSKDGHQHWCRECFRRYFRERGDLHREQSSAARRRRQLAARAVVREHLANHSCVDCGEDDLLVLEFDHHRGEKTTEVSRLVSIGARLEQLREEMARCEVVCVNCHRRRTAGRAGSFRMTGVPSGRWTRAQHRNVAFVVDVLRRSGCADCGERDPVVLDFDHVHGKEHPVAAMAYGFSLERLRRRSSAASCGVRTATASRRSSAAPAGGAENHWAAELHGGQDDIPPEGLEPSPAD